MLQQFPYQEINNCLVKWAQNNPPVQDFTVENVLFAIDKDDNYYDLVFKYLMSKRDFELIPEKVLLCPNNHKNETLPFEGEVLEEFDCFICGEVECSPDNYIPVFSFTDHFIKDANDLKKKTLSQKPTVALQLV